MQVRPLAIARHRVAQDRIRKLEKIAAKRAIRAQKDLAHSQRVRQREQLDKERLNGRVRARAQRVTVTTSRARPRPCARQPLPAAHVRRPLHRVHVRVARMWAAHAYRTRTPHTHTARAVRCCVGAHM